MTQHDPEAIARRLVDRLPDWPAGPLQLRPGVTPMASPMNQGVDWTAWRVRSADGARSAWLRVMHRDATLFADFAVAVEAAARAGEAGVGPAVLASDAAAAAVLTADLSETHRTATLDRLAEPAIREAAVLARKAVQAGPRLGRTRSVLDHIEDLVSAAERCGAALPQDWPWMHDNIRAAGAAIRAAGVDTVPAHGDGNASNLMIDAAGGVMLVDWDMAANMDPFEDLGSLLAEAHAFDPGAAETFEVFHGRFDAALFNRARLYGVADDLRWGLIGGVLAQTSARTHLEFLKYADWRMLRARFAMRDPRFEERVRRV